MKDLEPVCYLKCHHQLTYCYRYELSKKIIKISIRSHRPFTLLLLYSLLFCKHFLVYSDKAHSIVECFLPPPPPLTQTQTLLGLLF